MKKLRGSALLSVSVIFLLLFGALSVASQMWTVQYGVTGHSSNKLGARHLAESAVTLGLEKLLKDPASSPDLIDVSLPAFEGGHGYLTFNKSSQPGGLSIPVSVNNLQGTATTPGWSNRAVAPESANLVAVGVYRGKTHRTEVILHVPAYPYVVSSSLPILANNLEVSGVLSKSALTSGLAAIPPEQVAPGHVVSNALDPLSLTGADTKIRGDVQNGGKILLAQDVHVNGEVRPNSDAVPIPTAQVISFDTNSKPETNKITAPRLPGHTLSGFNRSQSLAVDGELKLDNGVLYVEGDLTVSDGLHGVGAIFATGAINIQGGGSLQGDHQAALMAKGPITIEGSAAQPAEFRGVVYTEGALTFRHANVVGTVAVNAPNGAGRVTLDKAKLIEAREMQTLKMDVTTKYSAVGIPPFLKRLEIPISLSSMFKPTAYKGSMSGELSSAATPISIVATKSKENPFFNPSTGKFEVPDNPNLDLLSYSSGTIVTTTLNYTGFFQEQPPETAGSLHIRNSAQLKQAVIDSQKDTKFISLGGKRYHRIDKAAYEAQMRDLKAFYAASGKEYKPDPNYVPVFSDAEFAGLIAANADQVVKDTRREIQNALADALDEMNKGLSDQVVGAGPQGTIRMVTRPFVLDMSQFFKLSDRVRVQSWREVP